EYDVYTEDEAGGSVALPIGTALSQEDRVCKAQSADGLEITLGSARVANPAEAQLASLQFEALFETYGLEWQFDPNFTYLTPMSRADGLVVNRKNVVGAAGGVVVADAFQTLMTRRNSFIGIRVMNTRFDLATYQQCQLQPQTPQCDQFNQWI